MTLSNLRKKIDELDRRLVSVLNERANLTLQIGRLKKKSNSNVFVPEREWSVYKNIINANKGPVDSEALKSIFREVMSASLALEKPLKIAYLGPEASFTHQACIRKFGSQVEYVPISSITEIFNEVEIGRADYGVVPIENSIEGAVNHTLDMFVDSELLVCSEILLEISHNLLSNSGLKDIKKVYSNPQVFGQCRIWLEANLPRSELLEVSSTTRASQIAAKEKNAAAIASFLASKRYNLKVVARSIEDSAHNVTRFLVIGKTIARRTGSDKTSIMFSIKDKPGALYAMLYPFKRYGINLTKIESRPSKKKAWAYYFFIDLEGHVNDIRVRKALGLLEKECLNLKVLGSYPAYA